MVTEVIEDCNLISLRYFPMHMQFMFATNAATILGGTLVGQEVEMRTMATFIYGFVMTVSWQGYHIFRTLFSLSSTHCCIDTCELYNKHC